MSHEPQPDPAGPATKPPTKVAVGTADPDDTFWDIIAFNYTDLERNRLFWASRPFR